MAAGPKQPLVEQRDKWAGASAVRRWCFWRADQRQGKAKQRQELKPSDRVCMASTLLPFTSGGTMLSEPWVPGMLLPKKFHNWPVKSAPFLILYHWASCGESWGSDQETTCPICNNLAVTSLPALGSLGRWSCGSEMFSSPRLGWPFVSTEGAN